MSVTNTSSNSIILGIDEVGRGPWAGPLVVGAVILKNTNNSINTAANVNATTSKLAESDEITGPDGLAEPVFWNALTDSKKLTAKRREALSPLILKQAAATGLGWVSSQELDKYGLAASLRLATRRAVKQILATKAFFNEIIIDGTVNFLKNTPLEDKVSILPKADLLIREVSAASIIAKVARDQYMANLAAKYPGYGFEKHVGYGTATHKKALLEKGVTPEHRQSFKPIKDLIATGQNSNGQSDKPLQHQKTTSTITIGKTAESVVTSHLKTLGHTIIAQNFRTKSYEIDLISVHNNKIYFTEVKYSQNPTPEGTPLVRVTPKKQGKMRFATLSFINSHPEFQNLEPILAVASVTGSNFTVQDWFPLGE